MVSAMAEISGLDVLALDRARISRDPRFDGKFFIAVTSTGIYCRPICPVRSPKRVHIRYYPTAAAAAEAGYRPCLRCRPEAAPGSPAWLGTSAIVRRALRLIDEGCLDEGSVEDLAARLGIGTRHLDRLFVEHVGASPVAVAQTRRLHFAKRLLDETHLPITETALAAGFGSVRRFNDAFLSAYGLSPRALRSRRRSVPPVNGDEVALRMAFRPPYDWEHMRSFLANRAIAGVERVDGRGYARTVVCGEGHAVVQVSPLANENVLEFRVRGAAPGALFSLSSTARRVFDLAADPGRIVAALEHDPMLAPLVRRYPGLRIPGVWDPFECAVRAVLGQQVSVAAGRTFAARLVERAGQPVSSGESDLTHLFPSPAALARANLDGLGLTSARVDTIRALAAAVRDGLDLNGPAEDVLAALEALPGIGAWTAQYISLRAIGEPDAFPASDLVLRRVASSTDAPLSTRELEVSAEAWRPWRGYAALHLWRAAADGAFRVSTVETSRAGSHPPD
jgi:AraC family transcriptional regulator, regulatory protein of adaptative response / DNA-3-methyladenine glycosylase II